MTVVEHEPTRVQFQTELARIESEALGGLDLAAAALARVVEAVGHRDIELAGMIVDGDHVLDDRYLQVQHDLLTLLARQAPVATDLRVVAALIHVSRHAERMGDQCVNIAKLLPLTGHDPPISREILGRVEEMGRRCLELVRQARRAFETRDIALAEDLVRQDEYVNRLNRECFWLIVENGDDRDAREWSMTMLLIARALERIGDNAVDVGEQAAFVVTGRFREFSDASRPRGEGRV